MKLVKVVWNDAWSNMTKHVFSEAEINHNPIIMESIGWLLKEDEVGVTIATDRVTGEEFTFRGVGFIPRGMIVDVVTLYERKRR